MKKILGVVFVVLCGVLCGCSDKKEEVILNVKCPALQMTSCVDPEINVAYEFLEKAAAGFTEQYKDADVKINLVQFELTKEDEAVKACFDTESAADVLYEGYFNMSTYVYTGRVVPLDDIISEQLREDIDTGCMRSSMMNGKTYMMPFLSMQNTLCYNRRLFEQAGLSEFMGGDDEVVSWTIDEWEYILSVLAQRLPENAFPMMMYAADSQGDTHIMTLLRGCGGSFFDSDGKVSLNNPEGIAALRKLRDGCQNGYFPPNAETLVITDNYKMFKNDQLAIYLDNAALHDEYMEEGINCGDVNFPTADGVGCNTSFITGFEVFDNGDEAKLAAAKAFVKYIYDNEQWLDYSAGSIPASKKTLEKYRSELSGISRYINNKAATVNFTSGNPNWRGVRDVFYLDIQELLFGEKTPEEIAVKLEFDCNSAIEYGRANSVFHE